MSLFEGWLGWALLSAVFAALTAIFAKIGLEGIDADYATLIRSLVIVAVLSAFIYASGKWSNPLALPQRAVLFLTLSGLATGASWVCDFRALQVGEASKVAPVDKLSIALVALFAFFILHERPSPQAWIGIALIVGGVLTLSLAR